MVYPVAVALRSASAVRDAGAASKPISDQKRKMRS